MENMCRTEKGYLEKLLKHASETRVFFGNKMKPERERSICRAFLRAIGVSFIEQELIAPTDEPSDVAFRMAQFQIREILEPDRRRGDDWKSREKKYSEANSLDVLLEPYTPPTSVSLAELVPIIIDALLKKAQKYGTGCKDIDALVYVNLQKQFLAVDSDEPHLDRLKSQGWRSVSILFPPYGVILFAGPTAPDFLAALTPGQYECWNDISSIFEPL
jgi:hypothetical protein